MRRCATIPLTCALAVAGCASPASQNPPAAEPESVETRPPEPPAMAGVSGLAPLERLFVVLHDTKRGESTPRIAVTDLVPGAAPDYRPLGVDWSPAGAVPSDLEALTPIPDAPGEFLAVESGHRDGITARIFHLRITATRPHDAAVEVLGAIDLPPDVHRLEGATLLTRPDGGLVLVLCERDERKVASAIPLPDTRFALLRWAPLDLQRRRLGAPLRSTRIHAAVWPEGKKLRTCSDLLLQESDLWIAATVDPEGEGRFDSIVYRTALTPRILSDGEEPMMKVVWRVRDRKVEALAVSHSEYVGMIIGTDQDEQGGTIELLPPLDRN